MAGAFRTAAELISSYLAAAKAVDQLLNSANLPLSLRGLLNLYDLSDWLRCCWIDFVYNGYPYVEGLLIWHNYLNIAVLCLDKLQSSNHFSDIHVYPVKKADLSLAPKYAHNALANWRRNAEDTTTSPENSEGTASTDQRK